MALDEKTLSRNRQWLNVEGMSEGETFSHVVQASTEVVSRFNAGQTEFTVTFAERNSDGKNIRWSIPISRNAHTQKIIDYFRSRGVDGAIEADMLVGLRFDFSVVREPKSMRDSTLMNKLRIASITDTRAQHASPAEQAEHVAPAERAQPAAQGARVIPFDVEKLEELREWLAKNNLSTQQLDTVEKRLEVTASMGGVSRNEIYHATNDLPSQRERINALIDLLLASPIPF
jgi:hypothetical protein